MVIACAEPKPLIHFRHTDKDGSISTGVSENLSENESEIVQKTLCELKEVYGESVDKISGK